jgi:hypothetical protein
MLEVREVGHNGDQFIRVNRFWHVQLETGRQSAYAIFDSGVGGQRNSWNIPSQLWAALAYALNQFVTILARHGEIRNQCIRNRVFESFERVAGGRMRSPLRRRGFGE